MPELPEVETVRRVLAAHLPGRTIVDVEWRRADVLAGPEPEEFDRRVVGARIARVGRRGKYLLLWVEGPAAATCRDPGRDPAGGATAGANAGRIAGVAASRNTAGPAKDGQREPAVTAGGVPRPVAARPAGGHAWLIVVHLRMTGRLTLARRDDPLPPHIHVTFHLDPGGRWDELRFSDTRRFGRLYLLDPAGVAGVLREAEWGDGPPPDPGGEAVHAVYSGDAAVPGGGAASRGGPSAGMYGGAVEPGGRADAPHGARAAGTGETTTAVPLGLLELGPEPLGPGFGLRTLARRLAGRRAPIKALLLDQRVVAGLGNIYADEALFRARIDPRRPAGSLSMVEVRRLVRAIRAVLRDAIAAGGTTFSDYRDGLGRQGWFAPRLAAYGRAGQACPRCGTAITTARLGGRTAHFCPACQG